jgi:hypothetical protein
VRPGAEAAAPAATGPGAPAGRTASSGEQKK